MKKILNYESAFEELKQIATDIENEKITVDELAEKLKRAALLVEFCQSRLKSTESEVSNIINQLETDQ